jgi:hypothetical protein
MDEPRNIFVLPLIAGILVIIAIFTPATYLTYSGTRDFLWLWGLYILDAGATHVRGFLGEIIHPSYTCSILIGTGGIILIVYAIKLRLGRKEFKNMRDISIFAALLILAGEILWLILIPLLFPTESFLGLYIPGDILSFWRFNYIGNTPLHYVGFAIIGGFIAVGLSFISIGVTHHYAKEDLITIPKREPIAIPEKVRVPEKMPEAEEIILPTKTVKAITSSGLNYCPACGKKIEVPSANFCTDCGHRFN